MEIVVPDEFRYLYVQNEERPVVKIPDPVLRRKADPVLKINKKMQLLAENMDRILSKANGIGLAAPQVGISIRLFLARLDGKKSTVMINPVIRATEGEDTDIEGCLSIPGVYGNVTRPTVITIEAYDLKGRLQTYELEGLPARIAQHELDHLDGVLFLDKVDVATLHWEHPDERPSRQFA